MFVWVGGMAFALGRSGGQDPRMLLCVDGSAGLAGRPALSGLRLFQCLWSSVGTCLRSDNVLVLPGGLCLMTFETSPVMRWEKMLLWACDGVVCLVGLVHVSKPRTSRWW